MLHILITYFTTIKICFKHLTKLLLIILIICKAKLPLLLSFVRDMLPILISFLGGGTLFLL
jgi:hypothetical protein